MLLASRVLANANAAQHVFLLCKAELQTLRSQMLLRLYLWFWQWHRYFLNTLCMASSKFDATANPYTSEERAGLNAKGRSIIVSLWRHRF